MNTEVHLFPLLLRRVEIHADVNCVKGMIGKGNKWAVYGCYFLFHYIQITMKGKKTVGT